MNIALIAHNNKKELMVQFCIAYCGILSRHNLCATAHTGRMVSDATGLQITSFLGGGGGGIEQIGARVAYDEIDLILFFRDPLKPGMGEPEVDYLLKLCDANNIPMATNIATAEVLIQGLIRGDFGWREIEKQNRKDGLK